MSSQERRRAPRIQPFIVRCVVIAGDRRLLGYVTDLSARGARIATPQQSPPIGAVVTLEMRFQRPARQVRVDGTVRWTRTHQEKGDFVFGLAFRHLKRKDQELLEGAMSDFASRAARLG